MVRPAFTQKPLTQNKRYKELEDKNEVNTGADDKRIYQNSCFKIYCVLYIWLYIVWTFDYEIL